MVIHVQSTPLCCSFDHRDIFQIGSLVTNLFNSYGAQQMGESSYLGSLGPHHTPIPATALGPPFPLHAPSEYTISAAVFFGAAILGGCAGPGAGVVTVLGAGWATSFGAGVGAGLGCSWAAAVLLELVEANPGVRVVGFLGVAVVVCEIAGPCGRLVLNHCSASTCVLNFLNLAPGYP